LGLATLTLLVINRMQTKGFYEHTRMVKDMLEAVTRHNKTVLKQVTEKHNQTIEAIGTREMVCVKAINKLLEERARQKGDVPSVELIDDETMYMKERGDSDGQE
jgi:predicted lactoylglutathione lyase